VLDLLGSGDGLCPHPGCGSGPYFDVLTATVRTVVGLTARPTSYASLRAGPDRSWEGTRAVRRASRLFVHKMIFDALRHAIRAAKRTQTQSGSLTWLVKLRFTDGSAGWFDCWLSDLRLVSS
jgi:hypothetical protein